MSNEKITTLTIDLETESLDPFKTKILLIAYSFNGKVPVYQVKVYNDEKPNDEFLACLADPLVVKRGHNTHFDLLCLYAAGYVVRGPIDDTRLLAYLEDPSQELDLKGLVERKLRQEVRRIDDFGISRLKKEDTGNSDFIRCGSKWVKKADLEPYNVRDVESTDRLRQGFIETDWYRKVERPLSRILFETEQLGIQLDIPYLERLKHEFEDKLEELKKALGAGTSFNPNSPAQVKEKFKENGIYLDSTDKHALKQLSWQGNRDATLLLAYRGLSKLQGTYIKPFFDESIKGRLHGRFNQAGRESGINGDTKGTATGRLSASDPNLQNIPSRSEEGRKIRKSIIATPGLFLIDSDLKQIEPRLVAHYSQSKVLLDAYEKGLDTHAIMGGLIFNKQPDKLTKLERFIGKTSWLATVYGCWYPKLRKIVEINSDEPVFYEDSFYEKVQSAFWQANPEISQWRETFINTARGTGSIETLGGRIIKIPGLNSRNKWEQKEAERLAINYTIQGSAADTMKLILVELDKKLPDVFLLATIHDEVLMETKNSNAVSLVNAIMSNTVNLSNVPMEADTKQILNWGEK